MIKNNFANQKIQKQNFDRITKLVQGVKSGNNDDFAELYKCMYQKIYFLAFSILKEKYMAEDIAQEVFIIVFKNIAALKNDEYFTAWANKITYNKSLEALNRNVEIPTEEENLIPHRDHYDSDEVLSNLLNEERQDTIEKRILKLTPELKTVVYLRYYNDLSLNDIAETMDCPVGTIKSRLNTAKKILRKGIGMEKDLFQWMFFGGSVISASLLKSETVFAMDVKHASQTFDFIKNKLNIDSNVTYESARGSVQGSAGFTSSAVPVNLTTVLGSIGVAACVAGGVVAFNSQPNIQIYSDVEQYVNHSLAIPIVINGFTTKDHIVVWNESSMETVPLNVCNEFYEVMIEENGTYGVAVETKGGERIEQFFVVDRIDKNAPEIDTITYDENIKHMSAFVKQDLAGVDLDKSYGEDKQGNIMYLIAKSDNEYIFPMTEMPMTIVLYDIAGNHTTYEVNFKNDGHGE